MGSDNFFMMTILVTVTVTITKTMYENENDNDNNDLFYFTAITIYPMKFIIFCVMDVFTS